MARFFIAVSFMGLLAPLFAEFPAASDRQKLAALKAQTAALAKTLVNADDDGKAVKAKVGGRVEIRLPTNASTGYSWLIGTGNVKIIAPTPGPPTYEDAHGIPGGGATVVFTFNVLTAGTARIEGSYLRFGKGVPARTFSVTVVAE